MIDTNKESEPSDGTEIGFALRLLYVHGYRRGFEDARLGSKINSNHEKDEHVAKAYARICQQLEAKHKPRGFEYPICNCDGFWHVEIGGTTYYISGVKAKVTESRIDTAAHVRDLFVEGVYFSDGLVATNKYIAALKAMVEAKVAEALDKFVTWHNKEHDTGYESGIAKDHVKEFLKERGE